MNRYKFDANGVLRQFWDVTTRLRYEYDAAGVQIGDPHPFTPEENAQANAALAEATATQNEVTLRDRARQVLTANNAAITELANFAAGTVALSNTQRDKALRDLAGHQVRILRTLNALIKLEVRDLSSTDGT